MEGRKRFKINYGSSNKILETLNNEEFNYQENIFKVIYPSLKLPDIKIAVIGKSGAGKTSVINTLCNIFEGKDYDDNRTIAITQNIKLNNPRTKETSVLTLNSNINLFKDKQTDITSGRQSQSQTQQANIYSFQTANCLVSLIDSPGIGDTRGVEFDKKSIHSVVQAVKTLGQFNAICLAYKADDARVDATLKYLITQYRSIMTKECENNILICFTHVSNQYNIPAIDSLKEAGLITANTPTFYFDNSCIVPFSEYKDVPKKDQKKLKDVEEEKWKNNYNQAQSMILKIAELNSVKGQDIVELYIKRTIAINLTNEKIANLAFIEARNKAFEVQKRRMKTFMNEIEGCRNHTTVDEVPEFYEEVVESDHIEEVNINPKKATTCVHHNYDACHMDCGLEWISQEGDCQFTNCTAFGGSKICKSCGCGYNTHYHTDKLQKKTKKKEVFQRVRMVKKQTTNERKKEMFISLEKNLKESEERVAQLEKEIQGLHEEKTKVYKIIASIKRDINHSALQSSNHNIIEYFKYRINVVQQEFNQNLMSSAEKEEQIRNLKSEIECYETIEKQNPTFNRNCDQDIEREKMKLMNAKIQEFENELAKQKNLNSSKTTTPKAIFSCGFC